MSDPLDLSKFSASETTDLMARCADHLDQLRRQAMQQAEILGLTCTLPGAKQRKPRRSKSHENGADQPEPNAAAE